MLGNEIENKTLTHNKAVTLAKQYVLEQTDYTIDHTPFEENVSFLIFDDTKDGWGVSIRVIPVDRKLTVMGADTKAEGIFVLILNPEASNPDVCLLNSTDMGLLQMQYADPAGVVRVTRRLARLLYAEYGATPERWRVLLDFERQQA